MTALRLENVSGMNTMTKMTDTAGRSVLKPSAVTNTAEQSASEYQLQKTMSARMQLRSAMP